MDTEFPAELDRFTLLVRTRVSTAQPGARKEKRGGRWGLRRI